MYALIWYQMFEKSHKVSNRYVTYVKSETWYIWGNLLRERKRERERERERPKFLYPFSENGSINFYLPIKPFPRFSLYPSFLCDLINYVQNFMNDVITLYISQCPYSFYNLESLTLTILVQKDQPYNVWTNGTFFVYVILS